MSIQKHKLLFISLFLVSTLAMLVPLLFKDQLRNLSSWGLVGIFLINFFSSATIFLPSPGIVSVAVGAQLYNGALVAIVSSIGSGLGEAVGYMLGHSSKHVISKGGKKKHPIFNHMFFFAFRKYGGLIIFATALIPNPLTDAFGIVAGLAGYPIKRYLIIVFIARLIRNFFIVYLASV